MYFNVFGEKVSRAQWGQERLYREFSTAPVLLS